MNNFTNESARKLARLLLDIKKEKREKILWCLDSSFRILVAEEIIILKRDMPLELQDTIPPGRVPNCS